MKRSTRKLKDARRAAESAELLEDSILDERSLQWRVAAGGYDWEDAGHPILDDPKLQSGDQTGSTPRLYNPLQTGGLYLRFANLESSRDDFQSFANQFGLLKVGLTEEGAKPPAGVDGESFGQWVAAHDTMRRAVRVRRWIDEGVVSECLVPGERGPLGRYNSDPGVTPWHLYDRNDSGKWLMSYFSKEVEPIRVAMQLVQRWINSGLDGDASMRVLRHRDRGGYVLRVRPRTLVGCMWWQFARAFTGAVTIVECRVCRTPLELGPDAFMSTRVFCSPACKQKDHRQRVKRAKELRAQGMSVARIAKKLDTEPEVITHWLVKPK